MEKRGQQLDAGRTSSCLRLPAPELLQHQTSVFPPWQVRGAGWLSRNPPIQCCLQTHLEGKTTPWGDTCQPINRTGTWALLGVFTGTLKVKQEPSFFSHQQGPDLVVPFERQRGTSCLAACGHQSTRLVFQLVRAMKHSSSEQGRRARNAGATNGALHRLTDTGSRLR